MGELTDIEVDGRHTRTLAVEAEDPAAVMAAVTALGLGDLVNTSVPRGLTSLIDDEPPRYAVIDVGTNSVKFHVGEQTSDGGGGRSSIGPRQPGSATGWRSRGRSRPLP